jgi:hypothetical protein
MYKLSSSFLRGLSTFTFLTGFVEGIMTGLVMGRCVEIIWMFLLMGLLLLSLLLEVGVFVLV